MAHNPHEPHPHAGQKVVVDEEKLTQLITIRTQLDNEIKRLESAQDPLKKRRTKSEALISRYINRETGIQNFSTETMQCYCSASDFYSLIPKTGREMLNAWILAPMKEGSSAEDYDRAMHRLGVLKNDVVKKYVDAYRLKNGAEQLSTGKNASQIEGGDLPDGVNMHREDKPNFRKK